MKSLNSFVVHVPKRYNDEIKTKSGLKLYLDTKFQPFENRINEGEVVSVPANFIILLSYQMVSLFLLTTIITLFVTILSLPLIVKLFATSLRRMVRYIRYLPGQFLSMLSRKKRLSQVLSKLSRLKRERLRQLRLLLIQKV
jgi:hypothetical protein